MLERILFKITTDQIWEKDGKRYHVSIPEKDLPKNNFEVIQVTKTKQGLWRWVYPRTKGEMPIWTLKDFSEAKLIQERNEN